MSKRKIGSIPSLDTFPLFESMFETIGVPDVKYPRYNIIKTTDNQYKIEISVPGRNRSDISLSVANNTITVSAPKVEPQEGYEYITKGMSGKAFKIAFRKSPNLVVDRAWHNAGVLNIRLVQVDPEPESRIIDIEEGK